MYSTCLVSPKSGTISHLFVDLVIVLVVPQLEEDDVDGVVGQPDGGAMRVQRVLQAEVLLARPKDGRDVLDGEAGRVLQVAVRDVHVHQLGSVVLKWIIDLRCIPSKSDQISAGLFSRSERSL